MPRLHPFRVEPKAYRWIVPPGDPPVGRDGTRLDPLEVRWTKMVKDKNVREPQNIREPRIVSRKFRDLDALLASFVLVLFLVFFECSKR